MKLKFTKSGEDNINIKIVENLIESEFDYVDFIKHIHNNPSLEESEFIGDISEDEKEKINEMIEAINEAAISKAN